MAAAGLRGTLLDPGSGSPGSGSGAGGTSGGFWSGLTLTGKTDAMVVQTASGQGRGADGGNLEAARAMVTRLRLGVEASRPILFESGTTLTPSLEVGLRHDDGDAETGFGLDLGIGLALSDPERGLQAEMRGRGLLAHESEWFPRPRLFGFVRLGREARLGPGREAGSHPDGWRVVLGRRRCALVAHHDGRAGGERPRIGVLGQATARAAMTS